MTGSNPPVGDQPPGGPSRGALIAGTVIVVATIAAYVYLEGHEGDTIRLLTFVAPLAAALLVVRVAGGMRETLLRQLNRDTEKVTQVVKDGVLTQATATREKAEENAARLTSTENQVREIRTLIEGLYTTNSRRIDHLYKQDERHERFNEAFEKHAAKVQELHQEITEVRRQVDLLTALITRYVNQPHPNPPGQGT